MAAESFRKCRVFVVDDERIIASTIAIILNQHGFEAREFYSGQTALDEIRLQPPDVVITDLVMPGMTGVELAVELRKNFPRCKIMLFSGHIDADLLLEDAQKEGHTFPVHIKPISPDRLLEMLGKLDPSSCK